MTELRVGDRIRDNDPTLNFRRVLTLVDAPKGFARVTAEDAMRGLHKISRQRIHTDGKPHRDGFSLLGVA